MEQENKIEEEPLLTAGKSEERGSLERLSSYQYLGRAGSVNKTTSPPGTEVSVDEIRSAAATASSSDRYYPPSLHAPLISSPEPDPNEQNIVYPGGYGGDYGGTNEFQSRPARTWKIQAVEDCNVYVGTLETFIEERETVTEIEPFLGGNVDGEDKGPELAIWELDLRSEFPVLFTPHKESRSKIPHSEAIEKCSDQEPGFYKENQPGFYKENQMLQCPACYGRGLRAHKDGSDSICVKCDGKGKIPCATCGSRGLIKCQTCKGSGSLLKRNIAIVRWKTVATRKVSATSGAASVPDDVFHRAKGVQLCNTQAYQCTPAFFADSFFLNKFSSEVLAERAPVPPTARVICERHTISVVPVTRVTMVDRKRPFSFYIIGFSREVYLKEYYPARFCWGLCPCLDWLKV
ncbi:hypothetical protein C3L33_20385, partial [Rhododendron williamsianum]